MSVGPPTTAPGTTDMQRTASFSRDGRYRYRLGRRWGEGASVTWVMLNPSTADARRDDPTIRRCIGFSRMWGFGALEIVNLFALRATEPPALLRAYLDGEDLAGPMGLRVTRDVLAGGAVGHVVAGWGNIHPRLAASAEAVRTLLPASSWCLGVTGRGQPRHPLYVRGDVLPVPVVDPLAAPTLSVLGGPPTMAA